MSEATSSTAPDKYLADFIGEFAAESDRASVIVGAAMLDQVLGVLLRSRLVPTSGQRDSLFDGPYAPISTFNARIELAFRVGLLRARSARDLHLIRKIRNDFAHNVTGCTFEDAAVRSRVAELVSSHKQILQVDRSMLPGPTEGPRGDFLVAVSFLLLDLWQLTEKTDSLRYQPSIPRFVPPPTASKALNEPERQ